MINQNSKNKIQEDEIENQYQVIDIKQRRQFLYSKYKTSVLNSTCRQDNLVLTKVLSSMPLYKLEKIYELKKLGIKEYLEKRTKKLKHLQNEISQEQQTTIPQHEENTPYSIKSEKHIGLRVRNQDETLTYMRDNFGVVVRVPQKLKLRTRKEIEMEEKLKERERRKIYNVKDKLDAYYGFNSSLSARKRDDCNSSLMESSQEISPNKNNIFNRNHYYTEHYNGIKIGNDAKRSVLLKPLDLD